ncbi:MAG: YigZ family protein [Bacteroidota bacterium]|nr:YigZ family protein [Bacteroidota bacterium]
MKQTPPQDQPTRPDDSYLTIADRRETEIKIVASRFLSYAIPAPSGETFMSALEALRREHYNATHHCFAYRVGCEGDDFRYSDDGEPGGTAGKRILGAIDRRELTDTGVVVVRYFGGTKLGVGGLARAYTDAADAVLEGCRIERRFLTRRLTLRFPYEMTSQVHHVLDMHGIDVADRRYVEHCVYDVAVRLSAHARFIRDLEDFAQRTVTVSECA